MKISDFVARGISMVNDMDELRKTSDSNICFSNGWVASIIDYTKQKPMFPEENTKRFSVAVCDYNGYFNWDILIPFGANTDHRKGYGTIQTDSEDEVCRILSVIENLKSCIEIDRW